MKPILLFTMIFFFIFHADGQEIVWKKQVSRTIDTRNNSSNKPNKEIDSSIITSIANAVKTGKVNAFYALSFLDDHFTTKMTNAQVNNVFDRIDSDYVFDTVIKKDTYRTRKRHLILDSVYQYRTFEKWSFNPATGKMEGTIEYIAPVWNIFDDDGTYRGKQPIFWIGYKNFRELLDSSIGSIFNKYLWQSNFEQKTSKTNADFKNEPDATLWTCYTISTVDFQEPYDTNRFNRFFVNQMPDTAMSELIADDIKDGQIIALSPDDINFNKRLTKKDLKELTTYKPERTETYDPTTGSTIIKITQRDFNFENVTKYNILESISFNSISGETEIEIKGVEPTYDEYEYKDTLYSLVGVKPMFWVRYSDIQPILKRIEEYHPNNTFAMHIWDSFFLSDTRQVLVKP